MLVSLHLKNLAIIEEAAIDLQEGLNILTGETGAGKSIIIGSINMALGAKVSSDVIQKGKEYALVELTFVIGGDGATARALRRMDIALEEDGTLIISRKIMNGRSVNKVNGETVTVSALKEVASTLIDLHGQHENQSLLYKNVHLAIVDRYGKESLNPVKRELVTLYEEWQRIRKERSDSLLSEEERVRELSRLEYEDKELEDAALKEGEEEGLEKDYAKWRNAGAILEGLGVAHAITSTSADSVGERIGAAIRQIGPLVDYDGKMEGFLSQLTDLEDLTNGLNREMAEYLADFHFDEEAYRETERRLDLIHAMQSKYGNTVAKIREYHQGVRERIDQLKEYEDYRKRLEEAYIETEGKLEALCEALTAIRKEAAKDLQEGVRRALSELNFLDARFEIAFRRRKEYAKAGLDDVEFMLATNPGEDLKPLARVASGGELSRIMLAIQSVLADDESIDTLVFDEVDAGISGRTAQKVSEKLAAIAGSRQVICITHLAQIAAMADAHYVIEKRAEGNQTISSIRMLDEPEAVEELARILGGARITDSVLTNAGEMRGLAKAYKGAFKN